MLGTTRTLQTQQMIGTLSTQRMIGVLLSQQTIGTLVAQQMMMQWMIGMLLETVW
jgi:hypothetical protein